MNKVDPCRTCKYLDSCQLGKRLHNASVTRYNAWDLDLQIFDYPLRTSVRNIRREGDNFLVEFNCHSYRKKEKEDSMHNADGFLGLVKDEVEMLRASESAALERIAELEAELESARAGESAALELLAELQPNA